MNTKNYLWKEGETPQEFADRLQKQLDEYKSKISAVKIKSKLDEEEMACQKDLEKYEGYLKESLYDLQESVVYDGTKYSKKEIESSILYFLNKLEVKWDFTLGLYELSKLWSNNVEQITYSQLDSTLRTLDQVQFKGRKEWKDILAVNEYFKICNEQFSIDTAGLIYLHQRHNAVLEQQELIKTIGVKNTDEGVIEIKKLEGPGTTEIKKKEK